MVEQLEVALTESMEWADRAAIIDPLTRKLYPMVVRRFNRQRAYFIREGVILLPDSGNKITEARTLTGQPSKSTVDKAVNSLDGFEFKMFDLTFEDAVAAAVIDGGSLANTSGLKVSFNLKSSPVLDYLRERSAAKMGRDVDQTTKDRLREVISTAYDEQWTRSKLVKQIKGLYNGFTARTPHRYIGSRAELIAVTELGNAMSYGTLEGARSLQAQGVTMEKRWALSSSACALCQGNAAQDWIALGSQFAGGVDRPLQHISCRCSLMTRAKPD